MKEPEYNKKIKVLVTASTFPRWDSDTEPRFVLDLAANLAGQFDITVLVPSAPGAADKENMNGVKVIRYRYFPVRKWETLCYPGAIIPRICEKAIRILLIPFLITALWWNLLKLLPGFDLVHAHWLIPQGIIQSYFKSPYIVTGHGGDVTSLNIGLLKRLKIRCLHRAEHVTVVSQNLKEEIRQWDVKILADVISMGCDTSKFGKEFYRENYFDQGKQKVILFVGRLAEKKGVTYLIEAMKATDALLVIAGDGPLRGKLEEQARKQGGSIMFLGSKTHEQLKTIYASADILVMPSVTAKDGDREGLPLVMLEAMASGIPVIASRSGGMESLVKDGVNGLLFEERNVKQLSEKIDLLLKQEDLCRELSSRALEISKQYDYAVIADKYRKLYEDALIRRKGERNR